MHVKLRLKQNKYRPGSKSFTEILNTLRMHDNNWGVNIPSSQLFDTFLAPVGNIKVQLHVAVHHELSGQGMMAFSTTLLISSTEQQPAELELLLAFIKNTTTLII